MELSQKFKQKAAGHPPDSCATTAQSGAFYPTELYCSSQDSDWEADRLLSLPETCAAPSGSEKGSQEGRASSSAAAWLLYIF